MARASAKPADEALAGGGVNDPTGLAGGDGGLVVGPTNVADVCSGDDCDGGERKGGVSGSAEFLGAYALEAGESLGGTGGVDRREALAVALVTAERGGLVR